MKKITRLTLGIILSLCYSLSFSQTSYSDDCSTVNSGWDEGQVAYKFSAQSGAVEISVGKTVRWQGVYYGLGGSIDVSTNKYINVTIKPVKEPAVLTMYLFDGTGNVNVNKRITPSENYQTYTFDFTGKTGVDFTAITGTQFTFNGASTTLFGKFLLDNYEVGTSATHYACFSAIQNQTVFAGTTSRKITITDITDASALALTGATGLIENVSVSAITNGIATITYDVKAGVSGTETATITATGSNGATDLSFDFDIAVEGNIAPIISPIDDVSVESGIQQIIRLSGISDGNPTLEQSLTITATSDNIPVTGSFTVNYDDGSPYADLIFTPTGDQTAITVTVTVDDGTLTTDATFNLDVYSDFNNPPTFDKISGLDYFSSPSSVDYTISGISDGNTGSETVTFTVSSSVDSVIPNATLSVVYVNGQSTANLSFVPTKLGFTEITITATDNGGGSSNGAQVKEITFPLEVKPLPLSGYTFDLSIMDSTGNKDVFIESGPGKWYIENINTTQLLDIGTYHGFDDVLHIEMVGKGTWNGLWLRTPDFDLTENPVLSYDIYTTSANMETHCYFWDDGWDGTDRNTDATHAERDAAPAGQWTSVLMDFRAPGMLNNSDGEDINIKRIQKLLFNYHSSFTWPFTNIDGDVYIKNIRIGDQAENVPPRTPYCTVNDIPGFYHLSNEAGSTVNYIISGISDGEGSLNSVTITPSSDNSGWVNPTISAINPDGTATLSYVVPATNDEAVITVTVSNGGASFDKVLTFDVQSIDAAPAAASSVALDLSTEYQTIHGFGTWQNKASNSHLYANDAGLSAMRIGLIGNQTEPVNDNGDPYVLDKSKLNYNVFDWGYLKDLKERGVETFILTSWSPPNWMKENLSDNYQSAGVDVNSDNTTNRLSYHLYEEFAESMVAIYQMLEEEAGIQLAGIGLQNEPVFHEPYASAILDPTRFTQLIEVVGARFALEGIDCKLFMPEQVFSQQINSMATYIDNLQTSPTADAYCSVIATHGYASNGIGAGIPDNSAWTAMWNNGQETANKKELWMTETNPEFNDYNSSLSLATNLYGALEFGNIGLWTSWGIEGGFIDHGKPTTNLYVYKNFAKFIRPGAKRISSTSANTEVLVTSYMNEAQDGSNLVSVMINKSASPISIDLSITGGTVPTDYTAYQTTNVKSFESIGSFTSSDIIVLAPLSITTIVGAGQTYTLTVTDGSGDGDYAQGADITITADAPPTGKKFDAWTGATANIANISSPTTTVSMPNSDITVVATYIDLPKYTLTVNSGTGDGDYFEGIDVPIVADAPTAGFVFDEWTGDIATVTDRFSSTTSIKMPAKAAAVTATYRDNSITTYTLSVSNGTIQGTTQTSIELEDGETATIIANTPPAGENFANWSGTGLTALTDVNAATTVVTMGTEAVTVSANFSNQTFDLTVTNGTGTGTYDFGSVVNITADAAHDDSLFLAWVGDISAVADVNSSSTSVTIPGGNVDITATYTEKIHTLTIRVLDGTTAIQDASVVIDSQTKITDVNGEVTFDINRSVKGYSITATGYPYTVDAVSIRQDSTIIIDFLVDEINSNLSDNILLYPNPASSFVNVKILNNSFNTFLVTDIVGRVMTSVDVSNVSNEYKLDVSQYSKGIYFLSIQLDGKKEIKRLIID